MVCAMSGSAQLSGLEPRLSLAEGADLDKAEGGRGCLFKSRPRYYEGPGNLCQTFAIPKLLAGDESCFGL
jgi:hypothetical protein